MHWILGTITQYLKGAEASNEEKKHVRKRNIVKSFSSQSQSLDYFHVSS